VYQHGISRSSSNWVATNTSAEECATMNRTIVARPVALWVSFPGSGLGPRESRGHVVRPQGLRIRGVRTAGAEQQNSPADEIFHLVALTDEGENGEHPAGRCAKADINTASSRTTA
jgi:hypothetical protein